MVGRLRTNFRSGNLAENLGVLLLKGVAAVADVPRTEDVGLDAVANLLRRDDDGNSYAEDTFVVQLKSSSVASVEYSGHQLEWFRAQQQPMFFGCVSLKESSIALYPTVHGSQALNSLRAERLTFRFDCSQLGYAPSEGDRNSAIVWLGVPLLKWTLADLQVTAWYMETYATLKRFLAITRREQALLSFHQCSHLSWDTNDKNSIRCPFTMYSPTPDSLPELVEKCRPCLHGLMAQAGGLPEETRDNLLMSLITLAAVLRDAGADVDPKNFFSMTFVALQHLSSIKQK
jgi:hypothetical protein